MGSRINWDHRWFGRWKETGSRFSLCPSIYDFIEPAINSQYNIAGLCRYLEQAQVVATTSRMNFPCVVTGRIYHGSLSSRTDGVWVWWDDLSHYIKEHALVIPDGMLSHIQANHYSPPLVEDVNVKRFEWPRLSIETKPLP